MAAVVRVMKQSPAMLKIDIYQGGGMGRTNSEIVMFRGIGISLSDLNAIGLK